MGQCIAMFVSAVDVGVWGTDRAIALVLKSQALLICHGCFNSGFLKSGFEMSAIFGMICVSWQILLCQRYKAGDLGVGAVVDFFNVSGSDLLELDKTCIGIYGIIKIQCGKQKALCVGVIEVHRILLLGGYPCI